MCDIVKHKNSSAVKWWKKAYLNSADSLLGDFTIKKWNDKSSRLHQLSRNTVARRCEDTTGNIQEDMTSCEWPFLQLHEYKDLTDVAQLCNIWVFAPQKSKTTFSSFHGLCGQNKSSSLQTWIQMEVISILLRIDICFQGGSSARNHAELQHHYCCEEQNSDVKRPLGEGQNICRQQRGILDFASKYKSFLSVFSVQPWQTITCSHNLPHTWLWELVSSCWYFEM